MKNPVDNFADSSKPGSAFNVSTWDFDLTRDFPAIISTDYSEEAITNFVSTVKVDPEKYAKGIDNYTEGDIFPKLKCNAPCLTCLDSDPDYCTSCWGTTLFKYL